VTDLIGNKKAALFIGCFGNYYYPEVGKTMLRVLTQNGVEVIVPEQVCCGLPMMARGNSKGAYKNIFYNAKVLSHVVSSGYAILTTCSSCSLFIKRDYSIHGDENATDVAQTKDYLSIPTAVNYLPDSLSCEGHGDGTTHCRPITVDSRNNHKAYQRAMLWHGWGLWF
jgi:hypothetical protein